MCDVIVFGGTTEGRLLADELCRLSIPSIVCTATEYGGELVNITSAAVKLRTTRMNETEMRTMLLCERPVLVLDATHPYATEVTKNLRSACKARGISYVRVSRETLPAEGCIECAGMAELVALLNSVEGRIFSALGAKEASALTAVKDFQRRVFLRILPLPEVLEACLSLGFPPANLVCMQGPFSRELNRAMFRESGARILLTKHSGANGGFEEKLAAARDCNMEIIVLRRPPEEGGICLSEAIAKLGELSK